MSDGERETPNVGAAVKRALDQACAAHGLEAPTAGAGDSGESSHAGPSDDELTLLDRVKPRNADVLLTALDALPPSLRREPRVLLREAIAALRGKQLARAEAAARQLVAHDPDSAVAAAALAESLPAGHPEERQRLDEAVERMDCPAIGPLERTARALSDHWRRPHGTRLVHRWLKLLQRQGLDDAQLLQATCRATELCPADMTCWTYHGQALAEIPDHRAAIEAYSRAIELYEEQQPITSGSYTVMWFNRACERAITGDAEGAFADLREAVRRDPRWIAEARADDYFDRVREDPRFDEALRAGEEFESFDPATPMHPVCEAAWRALQRARERGTSEPELVEALGYALAGAVEILEELVDLRVAVAQRDEAVTMSRLLFGRLQQGHLGLEGFFRLLGPYLGAPAA